MVDSSQGCGILFYDPEASTVLFFRRNDDQSTPYPAHVDILGGAIEDEETPDEAIVRVLETIIRDSRTGLGYELFGHSLFRVHQDPEGVTRHIFAKEMDFSVDEMELLEGQEFVLLDMDQAEDEDFAFNVYAPVTEFFEQISAKVLQ